MQTKAEKLVRGRAKKSEDLKLSNFPELIKNDIALFIERCKKNHWKYEDDVDWDGTVGLFIYCSKAFPEMNYLITFNNEGFLCSIYSDFEYQQSNKEDK